MSFAPPCGNISVRRPFAKKAPLLLPTGFPPCAGSSADAARALIAFAVVIFCFANRTIEVGLYGTDLARSGDHPLTAADISSAKLITFEQDTPFDQWQNQPLAWNERAKIWVDNEHDLLHIVHRVSHGQIVMETQPLAADQRDPARADQEACRVAEKLVRLKPVLRPDRLRGFAGAIKSMKERAIVAFFVVRETAAV